MVSAPSSDGTYWIGACVDGVSGESSASNNCSAGVQVTVSTPTTPDLVVDSPSVSDSALVPDQPFTVSATVRNQGTGLSSSTTLRYYRSTDSTISTGDTQIGTDAVSSLSAGSTSPESATVAAPSSDGTYWIGACVDGVSGESSTSNNCSTGVEVMVSSSCDDLVISHEILSSTQSFSACADLLAGPSLTIASPAHVTLEAGGSVVFYDGFSVLDGAGLTVVSGGSTSP
jgi:hypothetical protein